jgi:hypothetical protein
MADNRSLLAAAMPRNRRATCNSAVAILLPAVELVRRTQEEKRYAMAGKQATAHRCASRPFVFTLPLTKCTDGVDPLWVDKTASGRKINELRRGPVAAPSSREARSRRRRSRSRAE